MKTCSRKSSCRELQRHHRIQCPPSSLPPSSSSHHHRHHHHFKSRTMSFKKNSIGATKVLVNGAWIIWIYLFAIFIRLEYVDAKIGYFWHITDLHLDTTYSTKGDVTKNCWHMDQHHQTNSVNSKPGRFGDYMCDSPWSLLESATQAMKSRQGDNVEFVLWTGDALTHSMRGSIETRRLEVLRNITDLLSRTFPSQFVFPVLGHDDGLGHGINFRILGELWRHWLPNEALETFNRGGYYTIEQTKSKLRIIALNTNFMRHDIKYQQTHSSPIRQRPSMSDLNDHNYRYHHGNHYRSNGINGYSAGNFDEHGGTVSALSGENHEAQKQWEWLEAVLDKTSRNKETVYIVGHIPPGSDERQMGAQPNGHTTFSEINNLRYLQLVRKYSSVILGQFFGHLHSDSFRIIYNDNGKPVSWIMIAPSVTPKKQSIGSNNPAMRLYKFDTDTGQVLDYTQYYLNLDDANKAGEAMWQAEYNLTTQYFGSGEVNAVALHNLADRFSNTDNPMFGKYYKANSVRYNTSPCEGVCALNHYCAITRVDYNEFNHCLETAASALAASGARPNVCIPIAANIALLLATYTVMKCQQRKLLFEWLQFLIVDLVICMLILVKCSRKPIVVMFDALLSSYYQWLSDNWTNKHQMKSSSSLKMLLSSPSISSSSSSIPKINKKNSHTGSIVDATAINSDATNTVKHNDSNHFSHTFDDHTKLLSQMCQIMRCTRKTERIHEPIPKMNNEKKTTTTTTMMMMLQLPMSQTHQNSYQFISSNCNSIIGNYTKWQTK
ncbi:acid sphingomyelinase-like phosphodiesterase 3b isoform X2 [Contarinia nasturtii]|uniref:acid sphingomyelinase-like phosphodiesterase 3b isoform X2 n=1 Tax=Contarinia nasturtii TaxID=265458 RepID=UPI0012D41B6C|nr:acid sphingomyelinase-like phosphodiesterase 3b isoform X2 [Contarinia nasturtii]